MKNRCHLNVVEITSSLDFYVQKMRSDDILGSSSRVEKYVFAAFLLAAFLEGTINQDYGLIM